MIGGGGGGSVMSLKHIIYEYVSVLVLLIQWRLDSNRNVCTVFDDYRGRFGPCSARVLK